jgi:hypothetical protein
MMRCGLFNATKAIIKQPRRIERRGFILTRQRGELIVLELRYGLELILCRAQDRMVRIPVCTENLICVDGMTESPKLTQ